MSEDLNKSFIYEQLERACNNTKEKSSPGLDQIDYKMIRKLNKIQEGNIEVIQFLF